ncbi:hypothetical protein C8J57DRAFT_1243993 [Mycena rebaudengoi]|nr:hypothetical protein C8J57DRAFT_1243993 [Mycena rebaudengoi]
MKKEGKEKSEKRISSSSRPRSDTPRGERGREGRGSEREERRDEVEKARTSPADEILRRLDSTLRKATGMPQPDEYRTSHRHRDGKKRWGRNENERKQEDKNERNDRMKDGPALESTTHPEPCLPSASRMDMGRSLGPGSQYRTDSIMVVSISELPHIPHPPPEKETSKERTPLTRQPNTHAMWLSYTDPRSLLLLLFTAAVERIASAAGHTALAMADVAATAVRARRPSARGELEYVKALECRISVIRITGGISFGRRADHGKEDKIAASRSPAWANVCGGYHDTRSDKKAWRRNRGWPKERGRKGHENGAPRRVLRR